MRLLLLLWFACLAVMPSFAQQSYFVRFPDDVLKTQCSISDDYGTPLIYNPDILPIIIEHWDAFPTPVPDACYIFDRWWKIYNPATYLPALPCIDVPNPTPFALANHPANIAGPVISSINTVGDPWSATISKITPGDPTATNFSIYWSANANCYTYKQTVKLIDTIGPVITDCSADFPVQTDTTANDPLLWNAPVWWTPQTNSQDMREAPLDIAYSGYDSCSGNNLGARYLLYLDLDQDGVQETVVNSQYPPPPGQVFFGNASNPGFSGGTLRSFDQRPGVDSLDKYRFVVQRDWNSNPLVFRLRWAEGQYPDTIRFSLPQLPPGLHRIKWYAYDGCGNETLCDHPVEIQAGMVPVFTPSYDKMELKLTPNPFREQTAIRFYSSTGIVVQLKIWNAAGQSVFETKATFDAGIHQMALQKTDVGNTPGIYWYCLDTGVDRVVGKLVLLP